MANDGLGAVIKLGGSQEFRNALSSITQQLRETVLHKQRSYAHIQILSRYEYNQPLF